MKLRLLAAAMAVSVATSGVAMAQAAAPAAPAAPATPAAEKTTLSYAIGYDMASAFAERKVDLDIETLVRGVRDGFGKKPPTVAAERMEAALAAFQKRIGEQERARFEKAARENKAKSDTFMAASKAKPNVQALPGGVYYRVLEPGSGPKPTAASTVQVHLRGSLSTGQEFLSTYSTPNAEAASFKISEFPRELPVGMREVLQAMPVGSRWEIYFPADKAYGNDMRPIGPAQAVMFDVKLISSK